MIGVAFALHKTFGPSAGVEGEAFARVVREFVDRNRGQRHAREIEGSAVGAVGYDPGENLREAFRAALAPYDLREPDGIQIEANFRMEAARLIYERFVPFDDVAPTLAKLAGLNVPCVGLSGGWPSIDARKAELVGFQKPIIYAEDLGVEAGTPAAFACVARRLQLPADCIWFVGTELRSEIGPAAASGMRTIWIDRDGDGEVPEGARSVPEATVATFAQILDVLAEPYTRGLLALRHVMRSVLDWRPGHFISDDADPRA